MVVFVGTIMFLWRTFELCPFACMIRQLSATLALEAAALDGPCFRTIHSKHLFKINFKENVILPATATVSPPAPSA